MAPPDSEPPKSTSGKKTTQDWLTPRGIITAVMLVLVVAATWKWGLPTRIEVPGGFKIDFTGQTSAGGGDITRGISRKSLAGRWQVEQNSGSLATYIDWNEDGTFEGRFQEFEPSSGVGRSVRRSGTWDVARIDNDRFKLFARFDDGETWTSTFQVLGPDKIENKDFNYVSVRVPR